MRRVSSDVAYLLHCHEARDGKLTNAILTKTCFSLIQWQLTWLQKSQRVEADADPVGSRGDHQASGILDKLFDQEEPKKSTTSCSKSISRVFASGPHLEVTTVTARSRTTRLADVRPCEKVECRRNMQWFGVLNLRIHARKSESLASRRIEDNSRGECYLLLPARASVSESEEILR